MFVFIAWNKRKLLKVTWAEDSGKYSCDIVPAVNGKKNVHILYSR